MNPNLMSHERICLCFGGAIATPAGFDAALPLTWTAGAAAVPLGWGWVCGAIAVAGGGLLSCFVVVVPGLSGSSIGGSVEFCVAGADCWGDAGCGDAGCCAASGSTTPLITRINAPPVKRASVVFMTPPYAPPSSCHRLRLNHSTGRGFFGCRLRNRKCRSLCGK